jgi:hypothetical protein
MAVDAVLASLVKVYIGIIEIKGLDTITPENKTTDADMSTKDSVDGDGNQIERVLPARRGKSWKLEGKYYVDPADGVRDPGQAAVEALGIVTGEDAVDTFSFLPAGALIGGLQTFKGTVTLNEIGGGDKDEPAKWSVTINYYGAA